MILLAAVAFLLGWILAAVMGRINANRRARSRDPRDKRIRELEAELRIAQSSGGNSATQVEKLEEQLKETMSALGHRDDVISDQRSKLEKASADLRDSVLKTRELRNELTDRASQSVHAEAKIREVETELSVAQASTDMIATGVLDYAFIPDEVEAVKSTSKDDGEPGKASKASR